MEYRDPWRNIARRVVICDGRLTGARLSGDTAARDLAIADAEQLYAAMLDCTVSKRRPAVPRQRNWQPDPAMRCHQPYCECGH